MTQTGTSRLRCMRADWYRAALTLIACHGIATAQAQAADQRATAPPGWFHVFPIDERTYAISEPKYWQQNVSYLLLGSGRALLFDTGPGIYSIRPVVRSLTSLPLIVIPSHLHFDHVGNAQEFDDVRLLDTPGLRAQVREGYFVEPSEQYMLRGTKTFHVHGWIRDGQTVDLGRRTIQVISTPGHTPDSVSLIDAAGDGRLFTGDLVNREVTLCNVPGSDVKAMSASLHRLLDLTRPGSSAYEAHSEAPILWSELKQLAAGIDAISTGQAVSEPMCLGGTPMRRFNVGSFPILLPVVAGSTLQPLGSAAEMLEWQGDKCNEKGPPR
jgi:glyoxylase-like metal-dependent hydrolase (beta-lactamase superfamily II)